MPDLEEENKHRLILAYEANWWRAHSQICSKWSIETFLCSVLIYIFLEQSNALIALPGGVGTVDELFEAISW